MFKHLKLKWVLIKAAQIQYAYTKADTAKWVTFLESAIKLHPRTGLWHQKCLLANVINCFNFLLCNFYILLLRTYKECCHDYF